MVYLSFWKLFVFYKQFLPYESLNQHITGVCP